MAATLVTLQQAKDHLRITTDAGDPGDGALQQKLDAAEAAVRTRIGTTLTGRTTTAAWLAAPATVPADVKEAILRQVGVLSRFRGDDLDGQGPARTAGQQDLAPEVLTLLWPFIDRVIA